MTTIASSTAACASLSAISFLKPEEVAALIRDKTLVAGKDYQIIDVRDDDFHGGHIVSALNVPARDIYDQLPSLLQRFAKVPHVIFHCALSQVRGPKSARIYNEAVRMHLAQEADQLKKELQVCARDSPAPNRVSVLQGGFTAWQSLFKDHPERQLYIAEYDDELWNLENDN